MDKRTKPLKSWWARCLATLLLLVSPAASALERDGLAALLDDIRNEMDMPGLRAAVRFDDGRIVSASVGLGDVEADTPLNDSIGMPGGSTGKTFVAALTLLLVEDGVLNLDDPASKWLGDKDWFQKLPNAEDIRVRHLLSHSSGISDYPQRMRFNFAMVGRVIRHGSAYFEPEELIGYVRNKDPLFPAGEGFYYTDVGYLVLGRLIEAAAGRSYYDLLQQRILGPHGLDQIRPATQSALPDITPGYMGGGRNLKKDGRMKFDPRSEWTGGGLVTNPTMLVEFVSGLADSRIISSESFTLMLKGGWRDPESPDWHYGLGVFVRANGSGMAHGGLWPGYRTHFYHDVEMGLTIAAQTNRDGSIKMADVVRRIHSLALQ